MRESTQHEYKRLAANFYSTRLQGQPPSPKRLSDALRACASEYRPDYWRKLRLALAFDQRERGYKEAAERLESVQNPVTSARSGGVKPKQQRVKKVTENDHRRLIEDCEKRGDREMQAALEFARLTGLRPAEMPFVDMVPVPSSDGSLAVVIPGAKQSHGGKRGADRVISLDSESSQTLVDLLAALPGNSDSVGRVQRRLQGRCKAIWHRRTRHLSLYSYRHQLGSKLKASDLDRREVAAIMGHQSTASVERYGDRRAGGAGGKVPRAISCSAEIRENHKLPFSQHTKNANKPVEYDEDFGLRM